MMWRIFRPSSSTAAARALAPRVPGQHTIVVQRVKITKPRFSPRTFLVGAGVSLACWQIYWSVVLDPFIRHVDREFESLSAAEKKALEEAVEQDSKPRFIPFPFTTKLVQQPPYRGSDPEWDQYIKISKDPELQQRIRADLANTVRGTVERSSSITSRCGNVVKVRRWWLDIDFPHRPPPINYSSGLLFENDALYWSTQPVDSLAANRLRKILWPDVMTISTWAFVSAMLRQHAMVVSRSLGFESSKSSQTSPQIRSGNLQQRKTEGPLPSATKKQTPDGTPPENASHDVGKTGDARPSGEPESGGNTNFVRETAMSYIVGVRQITHEPVKEFWKKLAQLWRPTKALPPRGCIFVSGFVELELSKGCVVIDAWAHWDPKTQSFVPESGRMFLRRIQMKRQHPLRD